MRSLDLPLTVSTQASPDEVICTNKKIFSFFFFFFFFYHLIHCSSFSSFRQKEMYTQELNGKAVCRTVYRVKRIKEQGWGSTATGLEEQEDRATKTGQKGNLSTSPISLPAQHYGREQPEPGTG